MIRLRICLALSVFFLLSACQSHHRQETTVTTNQDDKQTQTILFEDAGISLEIKYSGQIVFNDEGTAIKSITPDGYVRYRRDGKGLKARSRADGNIIYELMENGKIIDPGQNDKTLIGEACRDMIELGLGAEGRVGNLYRTGGAGAVLAEIGHLKTDNAKETYFHFLLSHDGITSDDLGKVIEGVGKHLHTDMGKEKILEKIAGMPLTGDQFDRILQMDATLGSDMDKGNLLKKLAGKEGLNETQYISLIGAAAHVNAEIDKSDVLVSIAQKMPKTEKLAAAYREAAKTIHDGISRNKVEKAFS